MAKGKDCWEGAGVVTPSQSGSTHTEFQERHGRRYGRTGSLSKPIKLNASEKVCWQSACR